MGEVNVTDALKAAEYMTPDLSKVVKEQCNNLNGDKRALHFSTIKEYETVSEGKQGEYTSGKVGTQVKEEAVPF